MEEFDDDLNLLLKEDLILFDEMRGKYVSENERVFFETMCDKEQYEPAYSNEALILEDENEEKYSSFDVVSTNMNSGKMCRIIP